MINYKYVAGFMYFIISILVLWNKFMNPTYINNLIAVIYLGVVLGGIFILFFLRYPAIKNLSIKFNGCLFLLMAIFWCLIIYMGISSLEEYRLDNMVAIWIGMSRDDFIFMMIILLGNISVIILLMFGYTGEIETKYRLQIKENESYKTNRMLCKIISSNRRYIIGIIVIYDLFCLYLVTAN